MRNDSYLLVGNVEVAYTTLPQHVHIFKKEGQAYTYRRGGSVFKGDLCVTMETT